MYKWIVLKLRWQQYGCKIRGPDVTHTHYSWPTQMTEIVTFPYLDVMYCSYICLFLLCFSFVCYCEALCDSSSGKVTYKCTVLTVYAGVYSNDIGLNKCVKVLWCKLPCKMFSTLFCAGAFSTLSIWSLPVWTCWWRQKHSKGWKWSCCHRFAKEDK